MRFEAITEEFITTRVGHRDQTRIQMRQAGYFAGDTTTIKSWMMYDKS